MFTNGRNQGYSANLSGGNDASRYFLGLGYDNDVGVVPWNYDKKFSTRVNADVNVGTKLRLSGRWATCAPARVSRSRPSTSIRSARWCGAIRPRSRRCDAGSRLPPPESWSTVESRADVDRTTLSLQANYVPTAWFTHRLTTGLDIGAEHNFLLYPRQPLGAADVLGTIGLGTKNVSRNIRTLLTLDYAGSLKYTLA